ncbi:MAG: hypothetical protein O3A51_10580, partial [Verrucomicrobia bacterium]|nr:hypothetical protein [Verrucomicrobiota bacterium]
MAADQSMTPKRRPLRRWLPALLALAMLPCSQLPALTIYQESFETESDGTNYVVITEHDDGGDDYFKRGMDSDFNSFFTNLNSEHGQYYYGGEDTNGDGPGPGEAFPGSADGECAITLGPIDVNGYENLKVALTVATPQDLVAEERFEDTDHIIIQSSYDGTTYTNRGAFRGLEGGGAGFLRVDADNTLGGEGTKITSTFQNFEYDVEGAPSDLFVRVLFLTDGSDEEAAFDNVRVLGDPIAPSLTITSPAAAIAVFNSVTNMDIKGTANRGIVGVITWTNMLNGVHGTIPAATNWCIAAVPLADGVNTIKVSGTNPVNTAVNDMVTINRVIPPSLTITNPVDGLIDHTVTTATLSGTANSVVVNQLTWTNTLTGDSGLSAAGTSWSIGGIALGFGTNTITVTGTNILSQSAADTVQLVRIPAPIVTITNPPDSFVDHTATTATISGTANSVVVNPLAWTNALTGDSGFGTAGPSWSIAGIPLGFGTNLITVTGTNLVNQSDEDSVQIVRVPAPVLSITFPPNGTIVPSTTASAVLQGTANPVVVGQLSWTNALTGDASTSAASPSWTIFGVPLGLGANAITVGGSNVVGKTTNDTITVHRIAAPSVVITNPATGWTVSNGVASIELNGTANATTVGQLSWSNALTGVTGTGPAGSSWSLTSIPLAPGVNTITVTGTNIAMELADDTTDIWREGTILFNEFLVNPVGSDLLTDREYIEILNLAGGGSASDLTILNLDAISTPGRVEGRWDLTGLAFGANGLLTIGEGYDGVPPGGSWSALVSIHSGFGDPAGLTNGTLESDDDTYLLVRNCSGGVTVGTDLDVDDNGLLDSAPWSELLDTVGWKPTGSGGFIYS